MIRNIDIKLNAAHPQLPILEATTFVGSPSAVMIHGVPPSVGAWRINAVRVVATYPDNTAHTVAAVLGAAGTWVATIPATETSGRVAQGLQILADGTDERGESVTGYVLGIAGLAVYTRDMTIESAAGVKYYIHLLDAEPTEPKEGDAYLDGSTLVIYHDGEWTEIGGGSVELDNTVTRTSGNGVKSSGIWIAIWGSLTALPGFSSLYDWCVAQLAGKASTADVRLTPFDFSEWTLTADDWEVYFDFSEYTNGRWRFVSENPEAPLDVSCEGSEKAVYLEWIHDDQTWRASREAHGYILGPEDQSNPNYNKPLQPKGDYAPSTNIAKSALAQNVQASLDKADTALQTAPVTSVNNKTGAVSLAAGDVGAVPITGGTMTGSLHVNGSLDVDYTESGVTASIFQVTGSAANPTRFIFYDGTSTSKTIYLGDIATLASPAFTGTPTAPTPNAQSADTQIATKKYVDDAVAGGGGGNLDYVMRVDPETGGIYYTTPDTNA